MRSARQPGHRPSTRQLLVALLGIATTLFVREAQSFLLPVFVAGALTFALAGNVRRLRRWGIPESVGAGLVLVSLIAAGAMLINMLIEPAANWIQKAPTTVEQVLEQIDRARSSIPIIAPSRRARPGGAPSGDPVKEKIASEGINLTGRLLGQFMSLSYGITATIILLYFLLASERWLLARTIAAVPDKRRKALVIGGLRRAQKDISLYLSTMALINLGLGAATAAAMLALGVPNPLLWGTVAGMLNFVPYLGPMMTTLLLLMAGVIGLPDSGLMVAMPALSFLALHAIESNFISPIVVGRRLALNPVAVFISVLFWGWVWGIAGAMIALPILLIIRIVCRRHRPSRWVCMYLEGRPTGTGPWRP